LYAGSAGNVLFFGTYQRPSRIPARAICYLYSRVGSDQRGGAYPNQHRLRGRIDQSRLVVDGHLASPIAASVSKRGTSSAAKYWCPREYSVCYFRSRAVLQDRGYGRCMRESPPRA